jgi:hypothetical protein
MPEETEAAVRDPTAQDVTRRWSPLQVALVAILSIYLLRLLRRWWQQRAVEQTLDET